MKRTLKVEEKKSILFLPLKKKCEFSGHPSILEVALANKININHSCGAMGSCTTCLVVIEKGIEKLRPPETVELEQAQYRAFQTNERLSCQAEAIDGLVVRIPGQQI